MAIDSDKVFDPKVREVRHKLRVATGAYKQAVADRDAMIVHLHKTEEYGIDILFQLFQVKRERIEWLLKKAEAE